MTKRTRSLRLQVLNDEASDDDEIRPSRRARRQVTYEEDEDDTPPTPEDDIKDDPEVDFDDDDDDEYELRKPAPRRRSRRLAPLELEDDEFHDDDLDDDDEEVEDDFVRQLQDRQFVATDDDEPDLGYSNGSRRRRKRLSRSQLAEPRKRGRPRKYPLPEPEEPEDDDGDDIQQEIADLYDSSPDTSPVKHKLREREKIDYTIPPPITNDAQIPSVPAVPGRRGRKPNPKSDYRRILFPTAGPFGGSDVISLFGTNIPPSGIPIPGMTAENNLTAIGNVSDLDSSDDEIAPINGAATALKPKPGLLLTGGTSTDKKKNSLSDTDPLGVDMNIDFSVVGGLDNYINQLKEMVALPLLYPEMYQNFSITPPRGVLFHGPPGTGKTLMARALAASCSTSSRKITFFMRKGADCLSKWVGEAERQLRLLFEEAKNQQPSIIFFDEIDGLAPVRSSKQEQIHASIVSTLLALMDGMDNRGQVIVIGATNRPDSVDPALRRPGRFDREFYFPLPDLNSRKEILRIHTRKWAPPPSDEFIDQVAALTKGYGGADLRALCTEAALNSIQRKYPQIYKSNDKLEVDPTKVKVVARDFMLAIEKIIPSSARSTSSTSAPLPDHLRPLLQSAYEETTHKLGELLPNSVAIGGKKKVTALDEAMYLDPTTNDADGGFAKQQLLKTLESARVCKPHLLICGDQGYGQQYLSAAILNYLEGFQVQLLDLGNVFGDSTRTPELAIIQTFIEARRHQPSIIFIPNIDIWFSVMPQLAKATLSGLLRNLKSSEKVLLLGVSETPIHELDSQVRLMFGSQNDANNVVLKPPHAAARRQYFESLEKTLKMKPYEFVNDLENRPKRKLKQLKVVEPKKPESKSLSKKELKEQSYKDNKLKNVLKIKLAGLMDLFKTRYKRFKKPIVDENLLYHLFEPAVLENPLNNYEVLYEKSTDPEHENMIRELATGKFYHNMDLDIIEERLWNGYYSEAKQFLKDIKSIVKDSITSGDRERILKANEMLTNAQFGIDDFNNPEFAAACKEMREREVKKQEELLQEHKRLKEEFDKRQAQNLELATAQAGAETAETTETTEPADPAGSGESAETADSADSVHPAESAEGEHTEQKPDVTEAEDDKAPNAEDGIEVGAVAPSEEPTEPTKVSVPEPQPEASPASPTPTEPAAESESEAEEVLLIDTTRPLVLGPNVDTFFNRILPELTENYNIEMLEIVMARLMDIVWTDRGAWDRSSTVQKLFDAAEALRSELN